VFLDLFRGERLANVFAPQAPRAFGVPTDPYHSRSGIRIECPFWRAVKSAIQEILGTCAATRLDFTRLRIILLS